MKVDKNTKEKSSKTMLSMDMAKKQISKEIIMLENGKIINVKDMEHM